MSYSVEFLKQLDHFQHKEIYAKITALNFNESPIETIEGRITAGSINVDGTSAVRRTCSLTVVAENFDYRDYIWGAKTKFKLEIGVRNFINPLYEDIIWFPQGIYILTSFNVARATTNFTINLSGKDKMCLLNGEIGGSLESSVDFGCIEEENSQGNWVIRKLPIQDIIRNAVHTYGKEPYHNIIINDLDTYGVELLEYRYDIPMYLYRSGEEGVAPVYDNAILETGSLDIYLEKDNPDSKTTLGELTSEYLEPLVTTLTNEQTETKLVYTTLQVGNELKYIPWYFTKIEYGQTAGYRETDLTYAGDLIANIGESLTSILDKIKNMLAEFEYFYNLEGQFVFQRKKSYTTTMWTPGTSDQEEEMLPSYLSENQTVSYVFANNELITAFNNNPNIANLRNDFSVWGERTGTSGAKIPVHIRYAIGQKPTEYTNIVVTDAEVEPYNKKYKTRLKGQTTPRTYKAASRYRIVDTNTIECDWREIIYQMALDYFKYNHLDDFELKIIEANPQFPTGRTGYESYYTDLQGFWRQLYYPAINEDYEKISTEYENLKSEIELLQKELYGEEVDYSVNKLGGIENDVNALNNILAKVKSDDEEESEKAWAEAEKLVRYWNTKAAADKPSGDFDFEGTAPKYDFKDEEKQLITDPQIYFGMLQDTYFRKQSELNTKQVEFNTKEAKFKALENDKEANFYCDNNDEHLYWSKHIYEAPYLLNFWFDFLDTGGQLSQYAIQNVGNRPKAIQDSNVKSIYFRETPDIVFRDASDDSTFEYVKVSLTVDKYSKGTYYIYNDNYGYILTSQEFDNTETYYEKIFVPLSGFKVVQVPNIESMFSISSQGKSAKERLDELLYQHSHCVETATITSVPIYYLQPNTRIKIADDKTHLSGDYIINKITIPLQFNGTMSLTVTKAVADII